nr:L-histidine N(alpha)-methyltransferase [Jannaschia sp. S6380]
MKDALAGLSAPDKSLPPKWFYDQRGSDLFERITELPEYYPTRTEAAILRDNAADLAGLVPPGGALVELGSGASVKTRILLDAGGHFGAYVPMDISAEFLHATADDLRRRYPALAVHPVVGDFTRPLDLPVAVDGLAKVGFFPGSTIGNLGEEQAVALLRGAAGWSDIRAFVLGVDLVKDPAELIAAYDDAQGVTAAFNLNILSRLNAEVHADFDLPAFRHEARWKADRNRIEMHLVSRCDQGVRLGGTKIRFAKGETIHTESCRKYTTASLSHLAGQSGWRVERMLTDDRERFAVAILRPR